MQLLVRLRIIIYPSHRLARCNINGGCICIAVPEKDISVRSQVVSVIRRKLPQGIEFTLRTRPVADCFKIDPEEVWVPELSRPIVEVASRDFH